MKPSIGRIVHFLRAGNHFAAVITFVHSDLCVNLVAFPIGNSSLDDLTGLRCSVTFDEKMLGDYTWHWPERVE